MVEIGESKLGTMSLDALRMRQNLARYVVRQLHTEWKDEEGAAEAQEIYEGQLKAITEEIRRRRREEREQRGDPKPPTQKMRMKPASLGAKTQRR